MHENVPEEFGILLDDEEDHQEILFLFSFITVDQVDIWNIIECFRENGLNTLEADTELNASRVEAIITSIFSQLNKRIPVSRQVDVQMSVNMLLNWLLSAYDRYTITSHLDISHLLNKLRCHTHI